ncbi:MAG: ATP-binding protein [Chitinophagales bacterium]|nr:ATP-binding protein [Chitinophagales bacterium]
MVSVLRGKLMFIVLFGVLGIMQRGSAQLDSLLEVVQTMSDSKERAIVYKDIAFAYYFSDPDKCIAYCDTLYSLSKKIGYKKGVSSQYYLRSVAYYIKEDYEKAIENCTLTIEYTRAHNFKDNELIALDFMGSIYRAMGLYEKSIEYQLQSLALSEEEGDTIGIAYANYNISTLYHDLGDKISTKEYVETAIQFAKNTDEYSLLTNCYNTYSSTIKDADKRWEMLTKAMEYANLAGSRYYAITVYQNFSDHYNQLDKVEKAIENAREAFMISEEFEEIYQLSESAASLGSYFLRSNQLDSAAYYLEIAKEVASENDYKIELEDSYYYLSELYQKRNNTTEALRYLQLAYATKDSVYNEEITTQLQLNSAKYEFEKNQRIISEQQLKISEETRKRNRIIFIALLLLAAISGIYQWYLLRQQKRKQEAEIALAQQQAEATRLRELDELKTSFFTNISHELRTPLTLILSPLADLQEQVKVVPIREKLKVIKGNAQRLLRLVNEIMDLAKVEAGKMDLQNSKVDLHQFIRRVFYSFESLADLRRIDFNLEYAGEEVQVLVDRDKLEKILHNLLSNAIKYTGAGGQVSMHVFQKNTQFVFEISDTGQGIASEDLTRVFDRFYQAKQSTLQGGTGVGLALSKELAELMGGELKAESEPEKGSLFRLVLTLEVGNLSVESETLDPIPETQHLTPPIFAPIAIEGKKARLLVVEDNPDMGKYLVQILSENYQCVLATDGQEALKQLKLSRFDCITSDVMMPNMDGFELREAINQNDQWRQIPFLLLTARHLEDDKIRGFQMGIDDYVTKPFSTRELQARIHNLITNKLERDNYAELEASLPEREQLSVGQQFLKQVEKVTIENIDDPQFGVEDLAKAVNYSSKQVGRLLKKHTGMSTVNFILEVRLQKARELLERRMCDSVMETQLEVGISSTSYFTKKFTERFGKNPSELL